MEMNWKYQLPNVLTLANLCAGLMVIVSSFHHNYIQALWFAVAAVFFDYLDGTIARMLKVSSSLGKELDSMADMISFGAAPGLLLFNYYGELNFPYALEYLALAIPIFAGYRLALFNITDQSVEYFKGLPTPALALACFSIPMVIPYSENYGTLINDKLFFIPFVLLGSLLMVSELRLFSLKLGSQNKFLNRLRIGVIILAVLLFILFKFFGLILCLIIYIVISLTIQNRLKTQ